MKDEPLPNICRACMKDGDTFQSIFIPDENTGSTIHLAEIIMSYAAVKIISSDGLPENICPDCAKSVSDFYVFKKKCEESDKNLRVMFGKSPLRLDEDESYISDLNEDSKESEVLIKAETFEEHQISIKDIVFSEDEAEIKPEYVVEPQEVENAGDDSIESKEFIGNETINLSLDLKAEYDSGTSNNKFYDDGEVSYLPLITNLGCTGANERKYQTSVKDADIVKPPPDDEAEPKYEPTDPFLELKAEYNSDTSNNKFYDDGEVSYFPLITTLGCSGADKRKHQTSVKDADIVKPPPEDEPEAEPKYAVEPQDVKHSVEPEGLIENESIDPFLELKAEYDSGTSNNKSNDDDQVTYLPIITTLGSIDTNKRKYTCKLCEKKYIKNSHLTRHMKTHEKLKPHMCMQCNKEFAIAEQLSRHVKLHLGIKSHVCKICTKGFNQLSGLKEHIRTHNGEEPFLCSTCGKGFKQLGNLKQHTLIHSGIKPHVCDVCLKGYASKWALGVHLRKHTGVRPFVCPVCNHGFTTSSSLTKHKRIHSGEKPYECEVCKMKFSRSGILARHRRTHTGEKPFICDVCGTGFRQSSTMKTHKKTHKLE